MNSFPWKDPWQTHAEHVLRYTDPWDRGSERGTLDPIGDFNPTSHLCRSVVLMSAHILARLLTR